MKKKISKGKFCRVKNRVDLFGEVVKVENRFVRLRVPYFKGQLEYPIDLVEQIEDEDFLEEISADFKKQVS